MNRNSAGWVLFYLVKHSLPELSKSDRELSKVADGATEGHFKSLVRTINYVLGIEDLVLLLQPKITLMASIWRNI
jgi:hypothetical protein